MHEIVNVEWVPQAEEVTVEVDYLNPPEVRNFSRLTGDFVAFPGYTYEDFRVTVQIAPEIPSRRIGTVHLGWYDPCDYDSDGAANTDNTQGLAWIGPNPVQFVGAASGEESGYKRETIVSRGWNNPAGIGVGDDYVVAAHPRSGAEVAYNWREFTSCGCGASQWILHHDDYEDPLNDKNPIIGPTGLQKRLDPDYQTSKLEVGAEIFINHDDDTKDGIPDLNDPVPLTTGQDRDLYELDLGITPVCNGEVHLWFDTNLEVWGDQSKSPVPALVLEDLYLGDTRHITYDATTFPGTVYFEGTGVGRADVVWHQTSSNGHIVDDYEFAVLDVVPLQWRGFVVDEGWHVSEPRESQQMGNDGFLRTHYRSTLDGNGNLLVDSSGNPYPQGTNHGGQDAETWKSYPHGFEMYLEFAFDGDEFVDTERSDDPFVSFYQNSGVYIYDRYEIQIFNTQAVVTAIADHSDPHQHLYPVTVDNTSVYPDGTVVPDGPDNGLVTLHHHTASGQHDWNRPEDVDGCIAGIPYEQDSSKTTYGDLVTAASQIILGGTNSMSIDFTPDPNGGNPFVVVMLNGYVTFTGTVPVTGGGSDGDRDTGDLGIHLQSHWGSGIKFTYEEVTEKPAP